MNSKPPSETAMATLRAAQRLSDRLWEAALPILAKACVSAVGHPSPTTGFMLAVALELGVRLVRHPLVRAISHVGARAWGLH